MITSVDTITENDNITKDLKIDNNFIEESESILNDDIDISDFSSCGDAFALYLKDISKYPILTKDEEYEFATKYRETKDIKYKQALVNHNLRLVINIAKHFKVNGVQLLDLVQEGNVGLMTAAEKYDSSLGYRFSTYATWWIKQAITRYIANSGKLIRLPVHANECLHKYNKFVTEWRSTNMDSELPPIEEIADHLGVSVDTLKIAISSSDIVSLNAPVGEEQDSVLCDFISDDTNIDDNIINDTLKDCISEVLNDLTDREREVIILRFGLNGNNTHTLEEVGARFGVTRERIRQIEFKAIRKLRAPKRLKVLKDFKDSNRG